MLQSRRNKLSFKNPILADLPMPIYTTRLLIRPLMPGDGKQVFEAVEETREHLRLWLPWVDSVKSWQDSERTAREFYADFILRKTINLAIFHGDKFIGMGGFNSICWQIPSGAIGYWCVKSAQGSGFIREAINAITLYAFKVMYLKRVTILCNDQNNKSKQVAEELGYSLETRALGLIGNEVSDDLVYGCRYVRFDCSGLDESGVRW